MECSPLPKVVNTPIDVPCAIPRLPQERVNQMTVIEEYSGLQIVVYANQIMTVYTMSIEQLSQALCNQLTMANVLEAPKIIGYWTAYTHQPIGVIACEYNGSITFGDRLVQALGNMGRVRELVHTGVAKILNMNRMGIAHNSLQYLDNILMPYENAVRFIHFEASTKSTTVITADVYAFLNAVFRKGKDDPALTALLEKHPFYNRSYVNRFFLDISSAQPMEYVVANRIAAIFK